MLETANDVFVLCGIHEMCVIRHYSMFGYAMQFPMVLPVSCIEDAPTQYKCMVGN